MRQPVRRRCTQRSPLRFAQEARGNPLQLVRSASTSMPMALSLQATAAQQPSPCCGGRCSRDFRPVNGFRFAFGVVCNAQTRLADGVKGLVNAPMFQLPSGRQGSDISPGKPMLCCSPFGGDRLVTCESAVASGANFENHCEIGHWRAFRGARIILFVHFALEYNDV